MPVISLSSRSFLPHSTFLFLLNTLHFLCFSLTHSLSHTPSLTYSLILSPLPPPLSLPLILPLLTLIPSTLNPPHLSTHPDTGGGLGHLAIQYANAMGLRVIAMDVGDGKLSYCKSLGAEFTVDAASPDAVDQVQ